MPSEAVRDRIKTWAMVVPFILMVFGWYLDTGRSIAVLTQRIDTLTDTNQRYVESFDKLATSINKLSESVVRLDERTKALERKE